MPRTMHSIVEEIEYSFGLPRDGISVDINYATDAILIGNINNAFLITRKAIDDNLYMTAANEGISKLLEARNEDKANAEYYEAITEGVG